MDSVGPDDFVFGAEESHGYLVGQYARDKDGAVACSLMSQLVAHLKQQGLTLHQRLADVLRQHGYHLERLVNMQMEGSEGMALMDKLMKAFRVEPPRELGGIAVERVRDYQSLTTRFADGSSVPLDAPAANMVMLDLAEEGNYFAVRPSGTEPKVKFYMFSYCRPAASTDLKSARMLLESRLSALETDIRKFAANVTA